MKRANDKKKKNDDIQIMILWARYGHRFMSQKTEWSHPDLSIHGSGWSCLKMYCLLFFEIKLLR